MRIRRISLFLEKAQAKLRYLTFQIALWTASGKVNENFTRASPKRESMKYHFDESVLPDADFSYLF